MMQINFCGDWAGKAIGPSCTWLHFGSEVLRSAGELWRSGWRSAGQGRENLL